MQNRLKALLVVALVFVAGRASAQDQSGGFFDKGFSSKGIIADSENSAAEMPSRLPDKPRATPNTNTTPTTTPTPSSGQFAMPKSTQQDATNAIMRAKQAVEQVKAQQKLNITPSTSASTPGRTPQQASSNIMEQTVRPKVEPQQNSLDTNQVLNSIAKDPKLAGRVPLNDTTAKLVQKGVHDFNRAEDYKASEAARLTMNPKAGVLGLIVAYKPQEEFEQYVRELARISRDKGVAPGHVYVVTGDATVKELFGASGLEMGSALYEDINFMKQLPGHTFSLELVREVPKNFNVKISPTWIIQAGGETHVFEGTTRPASLFDSQNAFYPPSAADNKSADSKVLYYNRFSQGTKLPLASDKSAAELVGISEEKKRQIAQELIGDAKQLPEKVVYDTKTIPTCRESKTQRIPTPFTSGSSAFDILYYAASDRTQANLAKDWKGTKVPYTAGTKLTLNQLARNPIAAWADALSIRCLPTRFRIESEGTQRYIRYDEGENAWQGITDSR